MIKRLVQRHVVDAGQVEENHVGLEAGGKLTDEVFHAERAGTPFRRGFEGLLRGEPLARIGPLHARNERRHAHGLEHILIVG